MKGRFTDWLERRRRRKMMERAERKYGPAAAPRFHIELNDYEIALLEAQSVTAEDHRVLAADLIDQLGVRAYDDAVMRARRRHAHGDAEGAAHWKAIAASIARQT